VADTITSVTIYHQRGTDSDSVEEELILDTSSVGPALDALSQRIARIAGGLEGGTVSVRVDSATAVAATASIDSAQGDATAGDQLTFAVPGYAAPFVLTAVSGTSDVSVGEYSIDTDSDAMAISLAAAVNGYPGLREHLSAAVDGSNTSLVNLTAKRAGTGANSIVVAKVVTTAGAHTIVAMSGGLDSTAKPSATVTFGTPDIAADDTISIGSRVYTWKAGASADGEITLSTTPAAAATNFAAAINADTTWAGLLTATRADAVVTLTWEGDPRVGQHIVLDYAETNAGSIVLGGDTVIGAGEALSLSTTITGNSATRRYRRGGTA
jgi:hypothetical protein